MSKLISRVHRAFTDEDDQNLADYLLKNPDGRSGHTLYEILVAQVRKSAFFPCKVIYRALYVRKIVIRGLNVIPHPPGEDGGTKTNPRLRDGWRSLRQTRQRSSPNQSGRRWFIPGQ
jgi:hypothetical protein